MPNDKETPTTSRASGQAGVVCVDLDGVLAQYKEPEKGQRPDVFMIGDPIAGAVEFIEWLLKDGFTVIVNSVRLNTAQNTPADHGQPHIQGDKWHDRLVKSLSQWLHQHGFPTQGAKFLVNREPGKPLAHAYVDARAVICRPDQDDDRKDAPNASEYDWSRRAVLTKAAGEPPIEMPKK